MEYAKNGLGIHGADHAETGDPEGKKLVIVPLECSLLGSAQEVRIAPGSHSSVAYGSTLVQEMFWCRYGLNAEYRDRIDASPLSVTGTSEDREVRIVELPDHPFYLATLFLPQFGSRAGCPHPLVVAFVRAACEFRELRASAPREQ